MHDDIARARDLLDHATSVAVLTGAGISAESGIPTFRDALTGLWEKFRPEELATPEAFEANPKLVWVWYAWRRGVVAKAQPNAGHRALADLERSATATRSTSPWSRKRDGCTARRGANASSSCTATSAA